MADVNRVAKTYLSVGSAIVATLKPSASGEAVAGKGFGGAEVTTAAPTKPVALPDWAEASVKSLKVPQAPARPADLTLSNGLRLIVRTEKASPTVTVIGSVKHEPDLQTPAGKDGADEVLAELFSYGTETRDRLAFQKALDDIAASESGGTNFNLKVLKQDFAKGVELLADNELHPALPAGRVPDCARPDGATRRRYAGQPGISYQSRSGYRAAAEERPGASGGDAAIGFGLDAGRRQSLLREGVSSRYDHHRGHRRHHARGSPAGIREMVRRVEERGTEAHGDSSGGAGQQAGHGQRAGSDPGAGLGGTRPGGRDESLSSRLLCLAAWQSRAGRRLLRHSPVSGSPAEGRVRLQRGQCLAARRKRGRRIRSRMAAIRRTSRRRGSWWSRISPPCARPT